jgi:hypothetical protein
MGSLFVSAGPNKGELHRISGAESLVGRDPSCSFQLTDILVSRQHFRVTIDQANPSTSAVIIDLGSVNGTLLNGQRLTVPTRLNDGDTIVIGKTTLHFAARQLSANPKLDMQHIPRQSEKYRQTIAEQPNDLPPQ